jgi:hypothetical protein
MGEWTLRKGEHISIAWGGQVYPLVIEDLVLDGPAEIRWQQGGKPPRLRSVKLVVREQTASEIADQAVITAAVPQPEPGSNGQSDVLDAVMGAVQDLDLDAEQP